MILGIILFLLAFILRSWHTSFSTKGKGFQREKAPKIMWTYTGIFITITFPIILSLISVIIIWGNIKYSWYLKLPIGMIAYWFIFWELPLILFQNPENSGKMNKNHNKMEDLNG